jgi:hypothetical protein
VCDNAPNKGDKKFLKVRKKVNNMYSSLNIIRMIKSRRMRWAGHVARMGETLRETGCDGMAWIDLAKDRVQ